MTQRNGLTYADAGVDIDAGNRLVDMIKPLVRATARPGADAEIGGFEPVNAFAGRQAQGRRLADVQLDGIRRELPVGGDDVDRRLVQPPAPVLDRLFEVCNGRVVLRIGQTCRHDGHDTRIGRLDLQR